MNKTMEEFKEICEQCRNNDNVEYIVIDTFDDEFFKDLLMEQQEQM